MNLITLTTDFGTADWFVGSMKGVILGINQQVTVVDITHDIPAGDVRAGAFALAAACKCFPRNTVHVAVVDPGVGSERAALVARTADYFFVGPDNGVLSFALQREKIQEVRRLENDAFFRKPVSNTFHGRDVFAPVAAHLTQGVQVRGLGSEMHDYLALKWPKPELVGNTLVGEIIYIDRFGNAISNIEGEMLANLGQRELNVSMRGVESCPFRKFYQEVSVGQPVAVIGSSGFLEIAVNGGNAAQRFSLNVGDAVGVR